jgi:hypothetical protein
MEELFSTMGVQPIDIKSFQKIELKLGKVKNYKFMFIEILHWYEYLSHFTKVWKEILYDSMIDAGKPEKPLALTHDDVTKDGPPFITVVVDGGWSHRNYGHRYASNSGVACVIDVKTKKLLHLGVRNKYCAMCMYL